MTKTLICTGTYKDGGSKGYKDTKGKEYWRNFKIPRDKNPNLGKLYVGSINKKPWVLAKGSFMLIERNTKRETTTLINQ